MEEELRLINSTRHSIDLDYRYEPESARNDITVPNEAASHHLRTIRELQKESPKYRGHYPNRMKLPIFSKKDEILEAIRENQVCDNGILRSSAKCLSNDPTALL